MNSVENYACPNCPTSPKHDATYQIQNIYTPCPDCGSIYLAKQIRSKYDNYWNQYYNTKSQNTVTDLISLQFAPNN
jgi:hypothetical protein